MNKEQKKTQTMFRMTEAKTTKFKNKLFKKRLTSQEVLERAVDEFLEMK